MRPFCVARKEIKMPRILQLGSRKRKDKNSKVELSKRSPFSGVAFPEGFRRMAFLAYVEQQGNVRGTRKALKDMGERVPSVKTLTSWAADNNWEVLRSMVDDGILDYLDAQDDPDIMDAIKTEAGMFKLLMRLRSTLYARLGEKDSVLMPRNPADFVRVANHINTVVGGIQVRMDEAMGRKPSSSAIPISDPSTEDSSQDTVPGNVVDFAQALKERGEPPTQSNIAREMLKRKEEAVKAAETT